MSAFDPIKTLLARYHALQHHQDPALAARLLEVQAWQKQRMQHTHRVLFAQPQNHLIATYFLNRLYGGPDFAILAEQFERVMTKTSKIENFAPASAVRTGTLGIELAVMAIELDEALALLLNNTLQYTGPLHDAVMIEAYELADQQQARIHQMDLLDELGHSLDKYVRSIMIQSAFKMAKGTAYKHHFAPVYDFTAEGFAAMKPLKSAGDFIAVFTQAERDTVQRVHTQEPDPFLRQIEPTAKLITD
jgi:hypothetical protein